MSDASDDGSASLDSLFEGGSSESPTDESEPEEVSETSDEAPQRAKKRFPASFYQSWKIPVSPPPGGLYIRGGFILGRQNQVPQGGLYIRGGALC